MNIVKKFYTENPNHYFLTGKSKPTEPRTYRVYGSANLQQKTKCMNLLNDLL